MIYRHQDTVTALTTASTGHVSVCVCVCGLPVMESWPQRHYSHTGKMNQRWIWVWPEPGLQLVSVVKETRGEAQVVHRTEQTKKKSKYDHRWTLTHPLPLVWLPPFLIHVHSCVWTCHKQQWHLHTVLSQLHHSLSGLWTQDQWFITAMLLTLLQVIIFTAIHSWY